MLARRAGLKRLAQVIPHRLIDAPGSPILGRASQGHQEHSDCEGKMPSHAGSRAATGVETSPSRCATRRFMRAIMPWKSCRCSCACWRPPCPPPKPSPRARAVGGAEGRGGKEVPVVEQLELRPLRRGPCLGAWSKIPGLDCPLLAEMALPLTMVASDLHRPVHQLQPMHPQEEAPAPQPRETGASF